MPNITQPQENTRRLTRSMMLHQSPLQLAAADSTAADDNEKKPRRFAGVALSGGIVDRHAYGQWVVDLENLKFDLPMPALLQHDQSQRVGIVRSGHAGDQFSVDGELLPNAHGQSVETDADAGFPFQLSVQVRAGHIEFLEAGQSARVNGREVPGPMEVWRNNSIDEVSIVALGADSGTSARVLDARADAIEVPIITTTKTEDHTMTTPTINPPSNAPVAGNGDVNALQAQVAQLAATVTALTTERDQARTEAATAAATLAAERKEARTKRATAALTALGVTANEGALAAYLSMDAAQFEAAMQPLEAKSQQPAAAALSAPQLTGAAPPAAPQMQPGAISFAPIAPPAPPHQHTAPRSLSIAPPAPPSQNQGDQPLRGLAAAAVRPGAQQQYTNGLGAGVAQAQPAFDDDI